MPTLAGLNALSDDQIGERLTRIRGIGPWTVEMMLIFRLGRPDVLPIHDYGVRNDFAETFNSGELPTPRELLNYGQRWRPYRTIAAW